MTVIFQKFIFRSDLQANPEIKYLFGDNLVRTGYGGQAKEMRDEPNAIGVATKRTPSNRPGEFFSDNDFEANCAVIDNDLKAAFEHRRKGGILVIPADGLGTGLSELPQRAPRTNAYLVERLEELALLAPEHIL
ncbi:hypothetical protein DSS3P8_139 [Roseobacter phage DSS3P8]|nr:hypothetical protein DSS3P8_139 [Roseobacter phage DSS3P8]